MIDVELSRLIIHERSDEQLIYLKESAGEREMRLVTRMPEALLLDLLLEDGEPARPLWPQLALESIRALDGELAEVIIDALEGDILRAKLVLRRGETERRIDARPSDALALALCAGVPLRCEATVFEACQAAEGGEAAES